MLINNLATTYIINIIAIIAIMVENKNQKILSRIFRDYKLPCVTDESVGVVLFFRGTINGCTLGKNTMPYSTCVYGEFILYLYIHTCIFHGNNHIQLTIGYACNDLFLFIFLFFGPVFCFLCFCFVLLCYLFSIFVAPSV